MKLYFVVEKRDAIAFLASKEPAEGAIVVTADPDSHHILDVRGFSCTGTWELLSFEHTRDIIAESRGLAETWYQPWGDHIAEGGIVIPELDIGSRISFFMQAALAMEYFNLILLRWPVIDEIVLPPLTGKFGHTHEPNDDVLLVWKFLAERQKISVRFLRRRNTFMESAKSLSQRAAARINRALQRIPFTKQSSQDSPDKFRDKIAISIPRLDEKRWSSLFSSLRQEGIPLYFLQPGLAWPSPPQDYAFLKPSYPTPREPFEEAFEAFQVHVNRGFDNPIYQVTLGNPYLKDRFQWIILEDWPVESWRIRSLFLTFQDLRPRAVIVWDSVFSPFSTVAEVANHLGIPTLSLPHGTLSGGWNYRPRMPARYTIEWSDEGLTEGPVKTRPVGELIVAGSPQDYGIVYGHTGKTSPNEQSALNEIRKYKKQGNHILLFLTASITGGMLPGQDVSRYKETLREAFEDISKTSDSDLGIVIKKHPGFDYEEFYRPFLEILSQSSTPYWILKDTPFEEVLQNADLVITMTKTSGLMDSLRLEAPTLFLKTTTWPAEEFYFMHCAPPSVVGTWDEAREVLDEVLTEGPHRLIAHNQAYFRAHGRLKSARKVLSKELRRIASLADSKRT